MNNGYYGRGYGPYGYNPNNYRRFGAPAHMAPRRPAMPAPKVVVPAAKAAAPAVKAPAKAPAAQAPDGAAGQAQSGQNGRRWMPGWLSWPGRTGRPAQNMQPQSGGKAVVAPAGKGGASVQQGHMQRRTVRVNPPRPTTPPAWTQRQMPGQMMAPPTGRQPGWAPRRPTMPTWMKRPSMPKMPEWAKRPAMPEWAKKPTMPKMPDWVKKPKMPEWAKRPTMPEWAKKPTMPKVPDWVKNHTMPKMPEWAKKPKMPEWVAKRLGLPAGKQANADATATGKDVVKKSSADGTTKAPAPQAGSGTNMPPVGQPPAWHMTPPWMRQQQGAGGQGAGKTTAPRENTKDATATRPTQQPGMAVPGGSRQPWMNNRPAGRGGAQGAATPPNWAPGVPPWMRGKNSQGAAGAQGQGTAATAQAGDMNNATKTAPWWGGVVNNGGKGK